MGRFYLHLAALHAKLDLGAGAQIGCFANRLGHNDTPGTVDGRPHTNIPTMSSAITQRAAVTGV